MIGAVALLLAAACPGVADAAAFPTAGPHLRGDLDGDGRRERIAIAFAPHAPVACGFFLTARVGDRFAAVRLVQHDGKSSSTHQAIRAGSVPRLAALALVDRRPGAEVVVTLWRGASSEGGSVYTSTRGRLVRMRVEGSRTHEFDWWGSITHLGGVDCVGARGSGLVATRSRGVVSAGTVAERRVLYRATGSAFEVVRVRTKRGLSPNARWRTDIPAVASGPPFRSCAVAVVQR